MKTLSVFVGLSLAFASIGCATAQGGRGGGGGGGGASGPGAFQVAGMAMVLASSTQQGGQGPEGSTILTHSEAQYNKDWWGGGLFYQFDKHGENQTDHAFGPKLELVYGAFYFELGYAFMVERNFTDRAIAKQSGNGLIYGFGWRFNLGAAQKGGGGGMFFQASYKYRTQNIDKQDGVKLSEPIVQTDGYPVFGLGYRF